MVHGSFSAKQASILVDYCVEGWLLIRQHARLLVGMVALIHDSLPTKNMAYIQFIINALCWHEGNVMDRECAGNLFKQIVEECLAITLQEQHNANIRDDDKPNRQTGSCLSTNHCTIGSAAVKTERIHQPVSAVQTQSVQKTCDSIEKAKENQRPHRKNTAPRRRSLAIPRAAGPTLPASVEVVCDRCSNPYLSASGLTTRCPVCRYVARYMS